MTEFQKNLMKMRSDKNMTQEELGKIMGVNKSAISKWERGETTPPLNRLFALCDVFDCEIQELVGNRNGNR